MPTIKDMASYFDKVVPKSQSDIGKSDMSSSELRVWKEYHSNLNLL
jgi:hypothetical protein